ncbi:hypothetical protein MLD38_019205 [Melastoma candidum]|uniref:Uncharacterized protein n=1 Tax=Melastoma candidum TaxID=119954 RepID=A0ACB9QZQ1_9MYRT|nr:hypothetical protein MLD38_019205 [Melastoma candidum]
MRSKEVEDTSKRMTLEHLNKFHCLEAEESARLEDNGKGIVAEEEEEVIGAQIAEASVGTMQKKEEETNKEKEHGVSMKEGAESKEESSHEGRGEDRSSKLQGCGEPELNLRPAWQLEGFPVRLAGHFMEQEWKTTKMPNENLSYDRREKEPDEPSLEEQATDLKVGVKVWNPNKEEERCMLITEAESLTRVKGISEELEAGGDELSILEKELVARASRRNQVQTVGTKLQRNGGRFKSIGNMS